jgi:hypothetical protein
MGAQSVQGLVALSTILAAVLLDSPFGHGYHELASPLGVVFALWGVALAFFWWRAIAERRTLERKVLEQKASSGVVEKSEFLADPNEDEEAAEYYLKKFRSEGVSDGEELRLLVTVSKIPGEKIGQVSTHVRKLYQCKSVEIDETGVFVKKKRLKAFLQPLPLAKGNLLSVSRALYRLVLDHGVAVEVSRV